MNLSKSVEQYIQIGYKKDDAMLLFTVEVEKFNLYFFILL